MMNKRPQIVVITGVSRSLGLAMSQKFIALGHTVIGCARSRPGRQNLGNACDFKVVDVSVEHEVQTWSREILQRYGTPDLVINNAALINHTAPLWEITGEEFDRVIDVNIKGVANVIRCLVPAMIARSRGVIVNFSSGWGRSVAAGEAPYCATKWAIEGLTKALAAELPPGMAAIPLNPGIINTPMLRTCFGESATDYPAPEEWAEKAVPFILKLGPEANGQSLSAP